MIKTLLTILFYEILSISVQAQSMELIKVGIKSTLIDSGIFNNYYRYDLGKYLLYNGIYENNLKFKIQDKGSHDILYSYIDTISDAMIYKPNFFVDSNHSTMVLMNEIAAEYSWGQMLILIKDDNVSYLGYLYYTVDIEHGLSIADYCKLSYKENKLFIAFEEVPIIYWLDESKKINGKDLILQIDKNGIK